MRNILFPVSTTVRCAFFALSSSQATSVNIPPNLICLSSSTAMARFSLLSVLVAFLLAISANALALEKRASLQQVTNYGANPANVPM